MHKRNGGLRHQELACASENVCLGYRSPVGNGRSPGLLFYILDISCARKIWPCLFQSRENGLMFMMAAPRSHITGLVRTHKARKAPFRLVSFNIHYFICSIYFLLSFGVLFILSATIFCVFFISIPPQARIMHASHHPALGCNSYTRITTRRVTAPARSTGITRPRSGGTAQQQCRCCVPRR